MIRARALARAIAVACVALDTTSAQQQSGASAEFKDLDSFYRSLPAFGPSVLDEPLALSLTAMPLACVDRPHEHPPARGYLWEATYTPVENFERTRVFYGCYDWHSAVNSTWALVRALKRFPNLSTAPLIRQKLARHLAKSNVDGEVAFFRDAGVFELPYGYAWTLKLYGELASWKDPDAARWSAALQPLAQLFSERLTDYFRKLDAPVRSGLHPNSALAMNLAWDYLDAVKDEPLRVSVVDAARRFYLADVNCRTSTEPGPSDFISPCLSEAATMGKVLDARAYAAWFDKFLPALYSTDFRPLTQPIDPALLARPQQLAARSHMIGLAFTRAEEMNRVAAALPSSDSRAAALKRLAAMHADQGMKAMHVAGYMGSHFLGAFSFLYLASN